MKSQHGESGPGTGGRGQKPRLPRWFKICVLILALLAVFRILQLQVFVEITYEGRPFLAALTELETYLVPLGLLLLYILLSWVWDRWFGSRDN